MTTEKLEKSVEMPSKKNSSRWIPLLATLLIVSFFANMLMTESYIQESDQNALWIKDYYTELDRADALQRKLDSLQSDKKELTSDEAETLQITNEQSREDYIACLEQPNGLLLSPWVLGMPYWELKVHNPEPILSTSADGDYWFVPGSACSIDRGGAISVTRMDDLYVLRPWSPPASAREYATCPDEAYHLVSKGNKLVWSALVRACLTKIKARDLGLSRPSSVTP